MAVVILEILRGVNLQRPGQHTPRYGLRLGLGILLLAAAAVVAGRKPKPPDPLKPQQGLVSRMVADPAPLSAFLVGLLVFAPGVTFLAAVQVIATARAERRPHGPRPGHRRGHQRAARVAAHRAAPGLPGRHDTLSDRVQRLAAGAWQVILICVLVAVGGIMAVNGIYGLAVLR